jgi:hypothetical protein
MKIIWALPLLLAACGGGSMNGADAGSQNAACGSAGQKSGAKCSGLGDCGGATNFQTVSFCDHCFAYADTQVCESGTCRMLASDLSTNIKLAFNIPQQAAGAQSFTAASLDPVTADGVTLTCAGLSSSMCAYTNNPAINARNSHTRAFAGGGADPTNAYTDLILAEAGSERLAFVVVTSAAQGKGDIKAIGCAEHIDVASGQTTQVMIDLK